MGWDGCGGGTGTDLDSIGWHERFGMVMRVWGGRGESRTELEGLVWV